MNLSRHCSKKSSSCWNKVVDWGPSKRKDEGTASSHFIVTKSSLVWARESREDLFWLSPLCFSLFLFFSCLCHYKKSHVYLEGKTWLPTSLGTCSVSPFSVPKTNVQDSFLFSSTMDVSQIHFQFQCCSRYGWIQDKWFAKKVEVRLLFWIFRHGWNFSSVTSWGWMRLGKSSPKPVLLPFSTCSSLNRHSLNGSYVLCFTSGPVPCLVWARPSFVCVRMFLCKGMNGSIRRKGREIKREPKQK